MTRLISLGLVGAVALAACGGDDEATPDAGSTPMVDASNPPPPDAMPPEPDAMPPDPVERGRYLVEHVALCGDCHTPRNPDGSPDLDNYLAGAECFIDINPKDSEVGCLHTRNLTNHATGLMNRTDAQIKDMFLNGMRPGGTALIPVMPYYSLHNMTADDADAIVAYLRTVTGVDHAVPANQAPWMAPPAPATAIDPEDIPAPEASDPNYDSAMRGRYLAAMAGACLECHTPELDPATMPATPIDMTKPFAGGRAFPGLPMPPFDTTTAFSANITQHATGLDGWTAQQIVDVLKTGLDPDGDIICPPMPAGSMAAYGGLTDDDALDIANYILTLPGIDNTVAGTCSLAPM